MIAIRKAQVGFTLIELLLIIALLSIIAGFSIPFYTNFVARSHLDTQTSLLTQSIGKAQQYATSNRGNDSWGVSIIADRFILFKGGSYLSRDTTFDETYRLPQSISVIGLNEVVFGGTRGETSNTGSITVSANNGSSRTIQIDTVGITSIN